MSDTRDQTAQGAAAGGLYDQLLVEHYDEFRRVARAILSGDGSRLQMQPTDLAHEAAIRLAGFNRLSANGRTHFLSLSARMMRQILIDEVRRQKASKRQAPELHTVWPGAGGSSVDLEALDAALHKLEEIAPDRARLVERRFFAGLSIEEIAVIDGVSESTIKRQWRAARAWLVAELERT
jgi:RNA polymerase sigma factor (TIGR02999 family)